MALKHILTGVLCFLIVSLYAQSKLPEIKVEVSADDAPLELATVYWPDIPLGATTDSLGQVSFSQLPPGEQQLEVSYVGYFTARQKVKITQGLTQEVRIELQPQVLEEVVVTGTMRAVRRSDSPIPVEVIAGRLFETSPAPNLFESVGMLSGVQPVINCNVCHTGDIQINGMEGVYTQVLLDGMPIVSGLGTVYGLMGIPNSLIERIEVVKGPAGSLYGSEAMAGQINIITKNAKLAPRYSLDAYGSSWGETKLDLGLRLQAGKRVNGLLGLHGFYYGNPIDNNNDGFTDVALQQRLSVFQKWQWDRPGARIAQLGARYVWENRWGGQTNWTLAERGGTRVYGESIYTNRLELFGQWQAPGAVPLMLQASYNYHHQDSYYGDVAYLARQDIAFAQAYHDQTYGAHQLLAGAALRYTYYNDNTPATSTENNTVLPGLFVQDEWELGAHSHLLSGLRLDWHPEHGAVWSPRLAWHQHIREHQQLRISAGSGFRVVNLFTEDHAALSGAREVVIAETLRPERSWSSILNYSWQIPTDRYFINLDATAFYTHFSNRILPDYDSNPQQIIYSNLDGSATTRGLTLQADFTNAWPIRFNTGITFMEVFQQGSEGERIEQIRAPRWSGNWRLNYTHARSGWSFDLNGQWFGPQRLPIVPDDFRPEYSPWYALIDFQVARQFAGGFEVYVAAKNILNFIPDNPILRPFDPFDQNIDDPVNNPNGYTFDPSYNYAPLQGIRGVLGVRWSVE